MKHLVFTYRCLILLLACLLQSHNSLYAQETRNDTLPKPKALLRRLGEPVPVSENALADSIRKDNDKKMEQLQAPADTLKLMAKSDSIQQAENASQLPMVKKRWVPDPKKATWLALIIPGGGQIYNRKYWKLPIVYGGFVGCAYALAWNSQMYSDYSQAYLDIMDDDPNTDSFKDFLPPRYNIQGNESRFQEIFRKKKDFYRRYRDLSIFCFIGVYALSVIDAYVDAELSNFDISKDLGLRVEPTVIENRHNRKSSVGVQCSLIF